MRKIRTQSCELFPFNVAHFFFRLLTMTELARFVIKSSFASLTFFSFAGDVNGGVVSSSKSRYLNGKNRFIASAVILDEAFASEVRSPK